MELDVRLRLIPCWGFGNATRVRVVVELWFRVALGLVLGVWVGFRVLVGVTVELELRVRLGPGLCLGLELGLALGLRLMEEQLCETRVCFD